MANKIASELQWADLTSRVKAKQDRLAAGTGIDITSNTISVNSINSTDWSGLWQ